MVTAEAFLLLQEEVYCLRKQKQQLVNDNLVLAREVNTLREVVQHYYRKDMEQKKMGQLHKEQIEFQESKARKILEEIKQSDQSQKEFVDQKFKGLMKDVFYKKMEKLEKQCESKKKEHQELLEFREKINRLYISWGQKSKCASVEELYKWVYNQVIKGQSVSRGKGQKSSGSGRKEKSNFSSSKEVNKKVNPFSEI